MIRIHRTPLMLVSLVALAAAGCGKPTPVRGEEVAGLDEEAMGTGLDRRDLQKMLHDNMDALQGSAVVQRWQGENRPTLAVLPIRNDTSEHIDSALDSLISDVETVLINGGHVRVISHENQGALVEEVKRQNTDAFDQSTVSKWGRQVGAKYFVTGKVFANDERRDDERRVQYTLFMQVLEAETGEILFQNKASVTKALVR
ncbi:MAG TPA: penicillin-binding protein activator LpoB [Polyangiaceae bacterium]|nr:penicillin-binding protein activator LpoB [Polyangiaceae bacterium]